MTVNATLILQMFNFCVTWVIIKYLFVHPVIRMRAGIIQAFTAVEAEREALLTALARAKEERYRLWHSWYLKSRAAIKNQPIASVHIPFIPSKMRAPEIPVQEVETLIDRLTETVVSRIERAS